jgi:hypothetical protein
MAPPNLAKPNPFSGLYHLTTAWTGGPEGASNLGALDPGVDPKLRRGVSKLSSEKEHNGRVRSP